MTASKQDAKRKNDALKRAVKSMLEYLRIGDLQKACKSVERFFEKYGTNEELDGFAHFTYAVQNDVSEKISSLALRIEQACHVGAIKYCRTRRNRLILEADARLENDLDYRLGVLLGPPRFKRGDIVGTKGWTITAILNEPYPDRVYAQAGYIYALRLPDGTKTTAHERSLRLSSEIDRSRDLLVCSIDNTD